MTIALSVAGTATCVASTIPTPSVLGVQVLSIEANAITNFSAIAEQGRYTSNYTLNTSDINFCNISL